MLINPDTLFDPIEAPRQLDTALPSRQALIFELNRLSGLLQGMAAMVDAAPFADSAFDDLDRAAGEAISAAKIALESFRLARECAGSS